MKELELSKAEEIVARVARRNENAETFYFTCISHDEQSSREERSEQIPENWLASAHDLKARTRMGFWQCLLSLYPTSICEDRASIDSVTYHHGVGSVWHEIKREDLARVDGNAVSNIRSGRALNFVSKVILCTGDVGYVPIIDFRLKQSQEACEIVKSVAGSLREHTGVSFELCESASSYHGFGMDVVDFSTYISVLGRALLFDPIVDGRHIGHQMIDGFGALRIGE